MSVALTAAYKSHRTTMDGAFSITFELPETMADEINSVYRMRDEALFVVVMTETEYRDLTCKEKANKTHG